jgi:hypothetical protein
VVVLEPPDSSGLLAVMLEAVRAGAALPARDIADAAASLKRILGETALPAQLTARARAFVDRYVCAFGQDAVARAKAALERICVREPKNTVSP